ncbi:MAG: metal-dependent hydrolase [Deltaproteobacteria bacterium]|nr:metal-dependent hydrolase [Deltaproteobacteria bacterium]
MSSLVGHALAGLAVYKALERPAGLPSGWPGGLLALGLAVAPDLDVVAAMLWPHAVTHRGPSHSLVAALLLALVAALPALRQGWPGLARAWPAMFLVAAAHPLLDCLMAGGPGVPFFWPWSHQAWLSPVQLVPTAYYAHSPAGLWGLLHQTRSLQGMALEIVMFLPLVLVAVYGRRGYGILEKELGKTFFFGRPKKKVFPTPLSKRKGNVV